MQTAEILNDKIVSEYNSITNVRQIFMTVRRLGRCRKKGYFYARKIQNCLWGGSSKLYDAWVFFMSVYVCMIVRVWPVTTTSEAASNVSM